jgi:outer membrane lipoprotein-sorting protein
MTLRSIFSRRAFAAALLAVAALPAAAFAQTALSAHDLALVDQATKYLQNLQEVQGRFEQTNPRGGIQTGDIFLKRPGKARFQYDPPSGLTVVSDGQSVRVWDSRLRTYDKTPLGATPLAILLARQIRLDQDVEVFRTGAFDDGFYLSARNAHGQQRTEGYITIVFGGKPLALRGWTLVDGQGQATKVKITSLAPQTVRPELFTLDDPRSAEEKGLRPKPAKSAAGPAAKTKSDQQVDAPAK